MNGELNSNYKRLQEALEAYMMQKSTEFALKVAFTIASTVAFTGMTTEILMYDEYNDGKAITLLKQMKVLALAFEAAGKLTDLSWSDPGWNVPKIPMPDPADWQGGPTTDYVNTSLVEKYKQMAQDANEAVKHCTPATFDEYINGI